MESAAAFETALAAQRAAIAREAKESDTLLLVDFMVKDSVNRVQQFSTTKVKDEGIAALSRSSAATAGRHSAGPGAQIAHRIYAAQDSANVTIVSVQGSSITRMLPAGVPVIDHLAAWTSVTPGWNTISPVIEELRSQRSPSLEQQRHPEVLELVLGAATEAEYTRACAWIREKHRQTREMFGALLLAADVECVQVQANQDYQSLEQVLADIVLSSGEQTRSFQLA
jgi:hypothetical protein